MGLKSEIRKEMIQRRKNMSSDECKIKSNFICKKIMESYVYKNSESIFCYASVNNEVSLDTLIEDAFKNGKKVAFPKVEGNNIRFYHVKTLEDLAPGYFEIPEPDSSMPAKEGDVVIVPGVAFSKNGERLGYGGGFYDRFLSENDIYSIGVGYDFQIIPSLPVEEHDIKINEIQSNY